MRRFGCLLFVLAALPLTLSAHAASQGRIEIIEVSGIIDGNVERAVVKGVAAAEREHAALVVLEINSAGSVGSGRAERVAAHVRDAGVPVATWIGPAGARARHGAALIWFAAAVRAMAPGSTVGPVATLDLRARGDATQISRVLERFGVHGQVGATPANQAKQMHWADVTPPSVSDVITALNGRSVTVRGSTVKLDVDPRTSEVRLHKLDLLGRALHAAAQPSITYLLVLLGLVGILFEAFHPSTGPAGVTGAFAIALAVYGIVVLGGSWLGLALIVAGVAGFAIDLRYQSLGVFTIAGFAGLVAGSVLLFHGPWLRVPPVLLAFGIAGMTAFLLGAMTRVLRDLRLVASGQLEVRDAHEHITENGQGDAVEP